MDDAVKYFFRPLSELKGIGSGLEEAFARLLGRTRYIDLLLHFPTSAIDRRYSPPLAKAEIGRTATLKLEVLNHSAPPVYNRKIPYKVVCADGTGKIVLTFFNFHDYLKKLLPVGTKVAVSGKVEYFGRELAMSHPDYIAPASKFDEIAILEPIYPLAAGLANRVVRRAVRAILDGLPELPEWRADERISFGEALRDMHSAARGPGRDRLAYDEIMANQLSLALFRRDFGKRPGMEIRGDGRLTGPALDALGYRLTGAQEKALYEICADMASGSRMLRLLQGDVGSGKTAVAMLALLRVVEAGFQGALMAPTEILAAQHFETLSKFAGLGARLLLLTGRDKGAARKEKLAQIRSGRADIAIGTHALFQEDVAFARLGLAVIDEQHKFGVGQRSRLAGRGEAAAHVLAMTATPIPRTLAMASFGDMDLSTIGEMPPGRAPPATKILSMDKIPGIAESMKSAGKAYWVCPLVEESEKSDLSAAVARFEYLKDMFGDSVALLHGKMKPEEKDGIARRFADPEGVIKILVATSVIEVGINVPEADIMIIEHAERFGLSQLHQLRGRIGRGGGSSTCVLLHSGNLSETARARLCIMRATTDGFRIAEEDLRLRGSGDMLGVRQSGLAEFKIADPSGDTDLFFMAMKEAKDMVSSDPELESERGLALRLLLSLFRREADSPNMSAG